jgi:hypothetical protein
MTPKVDSTDQNKTKELLIQEIALLRSQMLISKINGTRFPV